MHLEMVPDLVDCQDVIVLPAVVRLLLLDFHRADQLGRHLS